MTFPLLEGAIVYSDNPKEMLDYAEQHLQYGRFSLFRSMYNMYKYPSFFERTDSFSIEGFRPLEDPLSGIINMQPGKELDKMMEQFERVLDMIQCALDTKRKALA